MAESTEKEMKFIEGVDLDEKNVYVMLCKVYVKLKEQTPPLICFTLSKTNLEKSANYKI